MSDTTTNSLRGLVKTLNDVVVPAIPADDPLALQELRMVVRYLAFCRERVEHLYARARYELGFVKADEVFFQVIEQPPRGGPARAAEPPKPSQK